MRQKVRSGRPTSDSAPPADRDPLERRREWEQRERRRMRYVFLTFLVIVIVVIVALGTPAREAAGDLGQILLVGVICGGVGFLRRRRRS
ncbi:MAG: hypothetical protein ACRDKW_00340 [Actinomycetota bacterium]